MLRRYICLTRSSDLSFASNFFGNVKFVCGLGRLDGSINKLKLVARDTATLSFKAQLNLLVHSLYYTLFRHCFIFNNNYNKILKSDWLSTVLTSALTGQCYRTVRVMPVIGQYPPSHTRA